MSPFIKYGNGDLVSIKNIYKTWRQDDFKNFCLVPIKKIQQWGSCLHQKYLLSMETRWFSKLLSCPHWKNMTMGILSPSEIFIKNGDKMIFKTFVLSPLKKYDNGDLVSIRNIYLAWRQDDFQVLNHVPIKNMTMRILVHKESLLKLFRLLMTLDLDFSTLKGWIINQFI